MFHEMPSLTSLTILCLLVPIASASSFIWGELYVGACLQTCCCEVCSAPDSPAYPYGLLSGSSSNPTNPQVAGATCHVPTWQDQGYINSTSNTLVLGPNTLYWTSFAVFGNDAVYTAPTTCDCCQLSVATSCIQSPPTAMVPSTFYVLNGVAQENRLGSLVFEGGVSLSTYDYAEIRNDTYCGYGLPKYIVRTKVGDLSPNADATQNTWTLQMPNRGCYVVCYFQQNLTTPGWYSIGQLVVYPTPPSTISWALNTSDVLLEGNVVTITIRGVSLLSVFSDVAELRTTGACGSGSPAASTVNDTNGMLQVLPGADWCQPGVIPSITTTSPLNYIGVQYADCPMQYRLYVDRLTWTLTLPAGGSYTLCYQLNGTWYTSPDPMVIPSQVTAAAGLNALYSATGGPNWRHNSGWGGTNPCVFFGVRCDANGNVVSIYLSRNGLVGQLPIDFFYGAYFNTLTDLKLAMNALYGELPPALGLFRNLRALDLSQNNFTGTLPLTLIHMPYLQIIYLAGNFGLTGQLPYALTSISQQYMWLSDQPDNLPPAVHYQCPVADMICSNQGSTAPGVSTCGYRGITETECVVRGCCFNAQAPLVFGGTSCFTKVDALYSSRPPCQNGVVTCYET